ncbi:MAG: histidine kinase [Chitinophagaceae bacterium]|nr:histidine kinase [Chitinophagaceae bacterium]
MPTKMNVRFTLMHRRILITSLLLTFAGGQQSFAQFDQRAFSTHTRKDGLNHNYITGVTQDESGYIWVSTLQGLNRFDGLEFFPVNLKQFNCLDEYGDVAKMKYFGKNEIGIATRNGGFLFNSLTMAFRPLIVSPLFGDTQLFNKCRDIEKIDSATYATSTSTGFYLFDSDGKLKFRKDGVAQEQLGQSWFQFGGPIQRMKNGAVIQENADRYFIVNKQSTEVHTLESAQLSPALKPILIPAQFTSRVRFFADRNREQGLIVLNPETNALELISDYTKPTVAFSLPLPFSVKKEINWQSDLSFLDDSTFILSLSTRGFFVFHYNRDRGVISIDGQRRFPDHFVTAVFRDSNKILWVGTDKGLMRSRSKNIQNYVTDLQSFSNSQRPLVISTLHVDSNYIYVGSRSFAGLILLDPITKQLKHKFDLSGINDTCNNIYSIIKSPIENDGLWLCTAKGIIAFNPRTLAFGKIPSTIIPDWLNEFSFVYETTDSRNVQWFRNINAENHVSFFDPVTKKFEAITPKQAGARMRIAACFSIREDEDGNMWFSGDGICRWNRQERRVDSLIQKLPMLATNYVDYKIIDTDEEHNFWITTAVGLLKWNPKTGKNRLFTTANGLPFNIGVAYPCPDRDHIFMHTHKGMGWIEKATGRTLVFTERDGIPESVNLRYMGQCYNRTRKEYLFSYDNSLVALPYDFVKQSPLPQSLNINMLHVYHDTVYHHPSGNITLNHKQNDLGICFNAVNFIDPENHSFSYRLLKDHKSHWINVSRQSTIYLNDLSHGTYRLQIKLSAINKRWPDIIKELTIVIKPPYWKQTWFILLLSAAIFTILIAIYLRRVRQIRQKANLDMQIAQTEMKALHAQMNPHFVFNCLNSINEMILLNENTQASHYLSKFAHLIRTTLDHSTKEWISLSDTIEYLRRYIELEKIRRNDFQFIVETDSTLNANETYLPPMLIQPLLENAIWHSMIKDKTLEIRMEFKPEGQQLLCIVTDNGVGFKSGQNDKNGKGIHQSIGISNIQQRIRLLNEKYQLQSTLIIEDRMLTQQKGTIAVLRLPLKPKEI